MGKPKQTLSERARIEQETARLDALDVESAKTAFNDAVNDIQNRFGCKVIVQGKFVGDHIKTEILIVKNK